MQLDESLFFRLINALPDPLFVKNEDHQIILTNDAYCEFMSLPRDQIMGKTAFDFFSEQEAQHHHDRDDRVFQDGTSEYHHDTITDRNGKIHIVDTQKNLIIDEHGKKLLIVVIHDITEQQRSREAQWHHHAFLNSIVENIPHMIFVKDAKELKFLRFNKAGENLLGLSRETLLGKNDFDFFPEEQARTFTAKDREVLSEKKPVDIPEEPMSSPNGERLLHTKKIPILDSNGEPQYLLGISEDITETKLIQTKLIHAKKLEAVGVLAGGVAHEFNNILTGIMFSSGFIKDQLAPDDPKQNLIEDIFNACRRAGLLTRQLLSFSLQDVADSKTFDCNQSILENRRSIQSILGAKGKLVLDLAPRLSLINLDPAAFDQSLLNLADNAREAMPDGGEFRIATAEVDQSDLPPSDFGEVKTGDYVLISFSDTGIGMNAETKNHIFEPFFTTKGRSNGTGLGLAATFGMIKAAGGFICVDSEPGRGTTFNLYIPKSRQSRESAPATISGNDLPKITRTPHIFLVEDEEGLRKAAHRILQSEGYRVTSAANGEEALQLFQNGKGTYDLLLTDVIMPGMGGVALADHVRTISPTTRIIFMSGYANSNLAQRNDRLKDAPLLMKPITPDELLRKIHETLSITAHSAL